MTERFKIYHTDKFSFFNFMQPLIRGCKCVTFTRTTSQNVWRITTSFQFLCNVCLFIDTSATCSVRVDVNTFTLTVEQRCLGLCECGNTSMKLVLTQDLGKNNINAPLLSNLHCVDLMLCAVTKPSRNDLLAYDLIIEN